MTEPRIVDHRYQLVERLGAGAMGEVWKAQDLKFQTLTRYVAIKILKEDDSQGEDRSNRDQLRSQVAQDAGPVGVAVDHAVAALHDALRCPAGLETLRPRVAAVSGAGEALSIDAVLALYDQLIREPSFSESARLRARMRKLFDDEANSVASLRHDNIVSITDYGHVEGLPYLTMDYIEGRTLRAIIQRNQASREQRLAWMENLCEGLAYAHARHLVHRDIKPANLIVESGTDSLKILDFGVVRRLQNVSESTVGVAMGTLPYMSPEQLMGSATLDHRSDIFSVGSVFYELLTGKQAFPSTDSILTVLHRLQAEQPPAMRSIVPGIEPALEEIVGRALEKDRDRRYQDLKAMKADIARVRRRLEIERERRETPTVAGRDASLLIATARTAIDAGDFDQAERAISDAREVDPSGADVLKAAIALENARASRERAQQVQSRLDEARLAHERRDFTGAHEAIAAALALDVANRDARALLDRVDDDWREAKAAAARAEEVRAALAEADALAVNEQFIAAIARLNDVRFPSDAVKARRAEIESQRAEAIRQQQRRDAEEREANRLRRVEALSASGAKALRAGALALAIHDLAEAVELAPDRADLKRLLADAQARLDQEAELARDRDATIVRVRSLIEAKELDEAAKSIAAAVARGVPVTALASIKQLLDAAKDRRAAEVERGRTHETPAVDVGEDQTDPGRARARIIRLAAAGIVVAAIVIGGYMAWPAIFKPPSPPPPPLPAEVAVTIDVQPWARVRILKADNTPAITATLTTPFAVSLVPGKYKLECENGELNKSTSFDIDVSSGAPQTFRKTMPDFDPSSVVNKLLGKSK